MRPSIYFQSKSLFAASTKFTTLNAAPFNTDSRVCLFFHTFCFVDTIRASLPPSTSLVLLQDEPPRGFAEPGVCCVCQPFVRLLQWLPQLWTWLTCSPWPFRKRRAPHFCSCYIHMPTKLWSFSMNYEHAHPNAFSNYGRSMLDFFT